MVQDFELIAQFPQAVFGAAMAALEAAIAHCVERAMVAEGAFSAQNIAGKCVVHFYRLDLPQKNIKKWVVFDPITLFFYP